MIDRRNDVNAETGHFECIYKQVIPKTPAYMGLNLSLRGQRITPKCSMKPREKSPSMKSIQSIYTLARLASSSNRPRKSSSGATILDFMQCLNFKSRLDREKEMIRRKIQNSTLYRKPSFTYNIYNPMNNMNSAKITKNIRSEFKEDLLKKTVKTTIGDDHEVEGNVDEKINATADIQCIGNKYVDLTCNILTSTSIGPTSKYLEIPESNENNLKSNKEKYWENATNSILQANLSPTSSSSSSYQLLLKKHLAQENFKKSKTANPTKTIDNSLINCDINTDKILTCESLSVYNNPEFSELNGESIEQKNSPKIDVEKRKKSSKIFKKSSNSHLLTVGLSLRSKFSDANISLIETENILTNQKIETTTTTTKTKKTSPRKALKKSSHNKSNSNNTTKSSSKSAFASKKTEI